MIIELVFWFPQAQSAIVSPLMDTRYQDCTLLHVDADGFFASVEQALNPALRGRPVVTGAERGIIAAASYEAKHLGIGRGMQLHEARTLCPELVILPSDYEAYSLYSQRLFSILRRFTPTVEEYSIDEAFADLSGCSTILSRPLESVAEGLRTAVRRELGLTVSVGISLTKTLAKLCSKFRKPDGQTIVRREHVQTLLTRTPVEKVWGIGPSSAEKLKRLGIKSALDFTRMSEQEVRRHLHKPGVETWYELRGRRVYPVDTEAKRSYDSMMKGHTFSPPTEDKPFIYSEALRNMNAAFAKMRRHGHLAKEIGLCLRCKDYSSQAASAGLPLATAHDVEALPLLHHLFETLFVPGCLYRSTMVWLGGLVTEEGRQCDLFEDIPERTILGQLDRAVDTLNQRYGQSSVMPATLLDGARKTPHARDALPLRHAMAVKGEQLRRLAIPRLLLSNPI
jgi:DNA polymerase-4/DNA polymerase V